MHLSQRMAQQQVLAPQLQQSLAMLQAPTLELKALVEQELQANPTLEELTPSEVEELNKPDAEKENKPDSNDPTEPPEEMTFDPAKEKENNDPVDDFQAEFDKLLQLDQEWKDHFAQTRVTQRVSQDDEERRQHMFDSLTVETSLQEHLLEQVRLSELTGSLSAIGELIVGNIDDFGFLQTSVDELSFSTSIPREEIETALEVIQTFDPVGVGARDLRECLLIQLERANRIHTHEYRIINDHMDTLGKRRFPDLARMTGLSIEDVQAAATRIANLEPRPGRTFLPDNQTYVVPEVFVRHSDGEYIITTNNEHVPHLRISNTYKDIMSQSNSDESTREYIREKVRAGKFIIKSIHQRQQTIINIAKEIVKRQRDFLKKGITYLKPMTMVQVAEVVGVHETTVSRAVSGKYMETPQGIFEMKFFFTSGIKTTGGSDMSNTSVKEIISELIKTEPSSKPFSDDAIVKALKDKDIIIARRTVAKYRSELNILPSNLRKVY
ncbi:RNA polymerase factor sigma-54 [Verrucomicrobia bacterium]|nr:RNA polymerase factor sigma-54 [Verrucomicrobiota bacterium]